MPYSGGSGGTVLGSVSTVTGIAAAGQVVDATSASAAAWAYPPGYEWSYTQITASVNVTGTAEGSATTVISPAAFTPDGQPLVCLFGAIVKTPNNAAGDSIIVGLYEGASLVSRVGWGWTNVAGTAMFVQVLGHYRFTPTAAAHTYTIQAYVNTNTGTPQVVAGAGGSAANPPAFVRFVKA